MGQSPTDSFGVSTLEESPEPAPVVTEYATDGSGAATEFEPPESAVSRRRYVVAILVGAAVAAVPFCWTLWSLWGSPSFLRTTTYESNFYDLQTRAMFHGHLWLAHGAIGIEAFVHRGHEYTYFGLFPSIIRMPILAFTNSFDGKLTGPFILVAWIGSGIFTALLLWRVRVLVRGSAVMTLAEAGTYGVLVATVLAGSVFMVLAATPFTFDEDIAWSICLTIGSMFALLGVLERPSWGRVAASFGLVLAANLNRVTTGWACVVGAVLIAGWFWLRRSDRENRRWCIPMLGVGLVPLVVGCAVNYSKFGMLFGVPSSEQVWTHVNAYRRSFLAANHNSEVGTNFITSDIVAYLRPDGLRFTSVFPYVTLPASPAPALAGVLFDRRYRTASMTASMPLLFLLSCWGMVTAFRPRPVGRAALTRILLLAAGAGGAALFLWGYIAPRYLGDFVPFLALASAVAVADIWRRLDGRSGRVRIGALAVISLLAAFSIVANVGMAVTPNEEWNGAQVLGYVQAQKALSDASGHPLDSNVAQLHALPARAPADRLAVVGNCDGLYISNGEDYSTIPNDLLQRSTWMTVELGHRFQHTFRVRVNRPEPGTLARVPLVTAGSTTISMTAVSDGTRRIRVQFGFSSPNLHVLGLPLIVRPGSTHQVVVTTDPVKHMATVGVRSHIYLSRPLLNGEPIIASDGTGTVASNSPLAVVNVTARTPNPTLCQSIISR